MKSNKNVTLPFNSIRRYKLKMYDLKVEENKNKISAITLIDDKVIYNEDLNNVMLTPYEKNSDDRSFRLGTATMLYKPNINSLLYILHNEIDTRNRIITDYLYMNLRDILMSSIINFYSTYFPDEIEITKLDFKPYKFEMPNPLTTTRDYDDYMQLAAFYIHNYMNSMFSYMSTLYYNWLNDMIQYKMACRYNELFEQAYKLANNCDPKGDETDIVRFTTINTVFREAMNYELMNIYNAMLPILSNVERMVRESFVYLLQIESNITSKFEGE
jgi:hypothetical protein